MYNLTESLRGMAYPTKVNTEEIQKLADMLTKANIPYEIEEMYGGLHIEYPNRKERVCSVIQHSGSYGGRSGLLEIMGLLTEIESEWDDVVGYLSAEDVYERIADNWEEIK